MTQFICTNFHCHSLLSFHMNFGSKSPVGGGGGSGCAMVLGKLPVPGRPAYFDYSKGTGLLRLQ